MTRLTREVRRSVGEGRERYVVTLVPATGSGGAMVNVRVHGARSGHEVTVDGLYRMLAERAVVERRRRRVNPRRVSLLTGRAR